MQAGTKFELIQLNLFWFSRDHEKNTENNVNFFSEHKYQINCTVRKNKPK